MKRIHHSWGLYGTIACALAFYISITHLALTSALKIVQPTDSLATTSSLVLIALVLFASTGLVLAHRHAVFIPRTLWHIGALLTTLHAGIALIIAVQWFFQVGILGATPYIIQCAFILLCSAYTWLAVYPESIPARFGTDVHTLRRTLFGTYCACALSILLISSAYTLAPRQAKQLLSDMERIQALSELEEVLLTHNAFSESFPPTLPATGYIPDSELLGTHPYQFISDSHIQLCAVFSTELNRENAPDVARLLTKSTDPTFIAILADQLVQRWAHPEGRHCFDRYK